MARVTIEKLKNGYKVCKGDDEEGEYFETIEAIPPIESLFGEGEAEVETDKDDARINSIAKDLEVPEKSEPKEPKYADMGEEKDEDMEVESNDAPPKKSRLFGKKY